MEISGPKKHPRKTPDSNSKVRSKKSSEKKPKTDRTLKKLQSVRESLRKRLLEKNGQHFPPRKPHTQLPESFGEFSEHLSVSFHCGLPMHLALHSGPRGPANIYIYIHERGKRTWGKSACVSLGAIKEAPQQKTIRLLGPCGPKQILATEKEPNRRGSESLRPRRARSPTLTRAGCECEHPRAGLPASRCKAP